MKKISFTLIVLLSFLKVSYSQRIILSGILEKTVAGNQYGAQLACRTKSSWNFGGFYQESMLIKSDGAASRNPFYGITASVPLVKSDKLDFYFNTRAGIVNQFFFAVVPGLETELKFSKVLSLSALMSVRMSYPSALFKVNIKI